MIIDKKGWQECVKNNSEDDYSNCAVNVAREAMRLLDDGNHEDFDADDIITEADRNLDAGITGFMAGWIANVIVHCHSKGEEFKKSWNKRYALNKDDGNREGVINPALLTIKTNNIRRTAYEANQLNREP